MNIIEMISEKREYYKLIMKWLIYDKYSNKLMQIVSLMSFRTIILVFKYLLHGII